MRVPLLRYYKTEVLLAPQPQRMVLGQSPSRCYTFRGGANTFRDKLISPMTLATKEHLEPLSWCLDNHRHAQSTDWQQRNIWSRYHTLDSVAPSVVISSVSGDDGGTANTRTLSYTAIFTEAVNGFDASDITVTGTANLGSATAISGFSASADNSTFTFNVVATTDGSVTVSIAAEAAHDIAGNGNIASNAYALTIDSMAPGVSITTTAQSVNTASFTLTGTADAGSTVEVLQNGSSVGTTTATATNGAWTITVTLTDGANTLTATATDDAGNKGTSGAVIITLDSVAPSVVISSVSGDDGGTANTRTLSYTAIFTEAVNGFDASDITVTGTANLGSATAISGFSASADNSTFTFNVVATSDGSVTVSIAAGVAQDSAGNGNTVSDDYTLTIDSTAPAVSITTNTPQSVNTESFTLTGTADADSTVQLLRAGTVILGATATTTNGDWTITVTLAPGVNTFTATATDNNGNTSDATDAVIITLDTGRPGVTITSTSGSNGAITSDRTLSYTVTFDEAVSDFDTSDITVTGTANLGSPAVTSFSASADSTTYTFNVVATTDGSVTVSIAAGVAQDSAGNGNTVSDDYTLTIDSTAPAVSITTNTPQSVNTESFTLTGTADADSTVQLLRAGTVILGATATTTNGDWTITVTLAPGVNTFTATATDNNGNTSDATDAVIITLDTGRPGVTITSTSGSNGAITSDRTLSYTVTFDEAVSDFDTSDITVTGTANLDSPAVTSFSASADSTTYTFNVVATTDGSVTVSIAAGVAQDSAGNGNTVSDDYTLTIDSTAPAVSITTNTPQSVNTESFTLTGTADADSTVQLLRAGTVILGATATTTNGDWTITVTLAPGVNTFTATATDNNGNTSDATDAVIITLDTGRPGVTITSTSGSNGAITSDRTLSYTVTFDEAVSDFDTSDITVTGTANLDSPAVTSFSASADSTTYTFNVVATTDGSVTVSIAAGVAQDSAGNGNTVSDDYTLTIDSTAPTVSITTSTPQSVNTESFTLTGTADADSTVQLLRAGTVILGATATTTNGDWTITVTLTDGANTLTATATDDAGNKGTSGAVIITLDSVAPSVVISSVSGDDGGTANTRTLSYTAIFTEAVNGFDASDITVTGTANLGSATAISGFSASADNSTFTFNVVTTNDGNVTVSIDADVAQDIAGNGNTASNAYALTIDSMAPGVSITTTAQSVNTASFTLTGTADAGSTVEVLQNGSSVGTTTATATNGAWTITVMLTGGANTFRASSTDDAGNKGTSGAVIITLDSVAPSVVISSVSGDDGGTANTRTLSYTAIFTEAVNGFDASDITVTGTANLGSATAISGFSASADNSTFTFNVVATSDGSVTVSIAAEAAHDIAGNGNIASNAYALTIDSMAPGVSITTTAQSVNTASFTLTGTADAGSTVEVLQNGSSVGTTTATNGAWTITVMLTGGANTFRASSTDDAGNKGTSGAVIITLDSVAPSVVISSVSGDDGGTANTRTLSYTAIFTEAVNGFDASDITVTGTANLGSATAISGFSASADNSTFTFNVVATSDGSVTVSIAAEAAHDIAGNGNIASNAYALTIDSMAPGVSITTTAQSVNTASFTLTGTADAGSTVEVLQNGSSVGTTTATNGAWTITVMLTGGANTFRASSTDDAGNKGTSGAVIITLDSVAPSVVISSVSGDDGGTANTRTLSYTAIFTEAVNGFDASDITVTGTANLGSATAISGFSASADNSTFTFNVVATTDGSVTVSIAAEAAHDIAGNGNIASNAYALTIDSMAPGVSITTTAQSVNTASFTLTGTADAGSTVEVLQNGSSVGTTTATNGAWTITVTLTDGANTLTATATDDAGNKGTSGAVIITLDSVAPSVVISSVSGDDGGTANTRTLSYTAIFTEAVNGFDASDITVTGTANLGSATAISGFSASADNSTFTFNVVATSDGSVTVSIAAEAAHDIAGNGNIASNAYALTIDSMAPGVSITTTAQSVNTASFTLTGTADAGSTVEVLQNGSSVGTTTATATNGAWTITVMLTGGANTFRASSTDDAGNKGTSGAVIITLDSVAPSVVISSVSGDDGGTANTRTLSYTAIFTEAVNGFDASDITVTGTANLGSATAISGFSASADNSTFTFNVVATSDGSVTVSIAAEAAHDIAGNGNIASNAYALTIDSMAPGVSITTTAQSVNTASFTLTGTAEADSTVDLFRGSETVSLGSATATNGAWTITVTLDDGANTLTATATDRAGNTSDATDAVIITLDTGKPEKPAITTTAQSVNTASFTLTGTAEVGSTVNLLREAGTDSLGSATATATNGAWTITVTLDDGANTLTATATDRAGNTSDATDAVIITLDTGKPEKPAITTTAQSVNTASFTLTGTAEADSTVDLFRGSETVSLGSATATNGAWTITVTLDDGANTLTATATDRAGNTSDATDAVIITLDTGKPEKPAITTTAQSVNTASFTLTGTAEADSTVDLFRGSETVSLGSATATNGAWTITVTLDDGANTLTATATDRAGNTSDATDAVIITLDTGKPAKPAITTTAQSVNTASFTLTGTAEADSTVDLFRGSETVSLGSATATNGAWTITVTLDDGANTLTATATDRAGNTSDATDAVIITLDTGKPEKPAITTTAQSVNTASFTLTGTAEVGSTVNLLREAGTDSLGSTTATNGAWTITVTLTDGANTLTATATDRAGNKGTSGAVIITLDSVAPSVVISSVSGDDGGTANTRTLSYTAIFTEAVNGFDASDITVTGTANLGSATAISGFSASADNSTFTFNVVATSDGSVTVSIAAEAAHDIAGNGNIASNAYALTIDSMAPGVSITTTAQSVNTASFTLTGTADAGSTVEVLQNGSSVGTTTATNGAWTITVMLTGGANTFRASSTDDAGNKGTSGAVIITLDSVAPSVVISSVSGDDGGTANTRTLSYTAIFTEAVNGFDASDITVTGTANLGSATAISGFSASADNSTFTFNVVATTDGSVTVSIAAEAAHDIAGNGNIASNAYALTIDSMAPGVSITTTAQSVNTASFTLTGTADAGSTVEVLQNGSSVGTTTATATNGAWTITVTLDDGANTFRASSTDDAGNKGTSGAVIITLDSVAPSVVISSVSGDDGGTANTRTLSYTAIFTEAVNGFDASDITVTGTANLGSATAISGFSASADNSTFTFNVVATSDGSVTVSIAAGVAQDSAGNGNTVSDDYTLTIDSTAPAVSITTNTPQSVNTASFTLTGTADAGSTVEVLQNGSSVGTTTATATNGAWTITVTLDDGANTFRASSTDDAGNKGTSGAVIITLDSVAPSVVISSVSGDDGGTANTRTLSYTAIFTEAVNGFDASDITVTGTAISGSATAISGFSASADNSTFTFNVVTTNDGNVTVSIDADVAQDIAGNGNIASNAYALTIDSMAPGVSITTTAQSVNTASFTLTGTADAGSTVEVLQNGSSVGTTTATNGAWTITVMLTGGANTFRASSTDDAGNKGTSGAVIITLDSVAPSVVISSVSGDDGGTANTRTLSYTAIFTEAVNGFDASDITVTGTANLGSATAISGFSASADNSTFTFNVVATSDGSVTVSIAAEAAHDIAGNGNIASNAYALTIDSMAPGVSITTTAQSVNTASFTLTGTADAGSTVDVLKDGSTIGTTTATNGTWTLLVTLDEGANTFTASSTDTIGNKGTSGAVIITLDSVAPSVVISSVSGDDGGTANTRTLSYTAVFDEAVSDFDASDITVTGTAISGSGAAISGFSASADNSTFTFNVVTTNDGNVTVSIDADVAQDIAGNGNTASNDYTLTIDSMAPGVSITTTAQSVNTASFTLTGTADAGSTVEVLQNGSSVGTTTATATNGAWTITVTLTDGANTLTATATDDAGNKGTSGAVIITLDSVAPSVVISSVSGDDGGTANTRTLSYTAVFDEAVSDFDEGDITVTDTVISGSGTVISGFSATDSRTYTFNAIAPADVNVTVSIAAGVAHDSAGNGNTVSDDYTLTIDRTAPTVSITTSTPQSVNTESFTLTGTADAGSLVDVLKDGSSIGTTTATTNGTWTITVTLTDGANTFRAISTDDAGNTGTSGAVIITLDSVAPSVDISSTSGDDGGTANTRTLSYTAIFSEGVSDFDEGDITVTDTVNSGSGTVISGFSATDSRTYTFNAIAPADVNVTVSIAAGVAHDSAGNGNTVSDDYTLTIDSTAPTVSITTSTPQSVNTESFTLTGTADAGSLVDVLKDGSSIGTTTATTNGAWTITVTLTDGANTFRATATDDAGNTGTSGAVIITLDSVAPSVDISSTSGDDGGTANTRTLSYTAIFSEGVSDFDEGDITVTDTVNSGSGTVISGFDATDSRTYTFNAIAPADVNVTVSIAAGVAHDSAGNGNTASSAYTLTIDSMAPGVSITSTPRTVNTESFTLTGTADAGSTVELLRGTDSLGTTTATNGSWTITVTLTDGANTFTATATDNNGNTSDATDAVIITLDGTPETLMFISQYQKQITTNDNQTRTVTVTFGESKTVTVTIRNFTPTSTIDGIPAIKADYVETVTTKASNTLNIETAKDDFEFISHLPSVVKVDLLENAIVDISLTGDDGACSENSPCQVSLSYTDADLERLGVELPAELAVFHYTEDKNNKKWTELDSTVDIDAMTVTGETTSFSPFVLGRVDRYSTQFQRQVIARFTQALVANVARTVEGRVGAAFSDARQLASYQLDGQTVQLNGSDNLQDSMMNKLPHYAKALKDGGMDWKAMLSRSSFVLPLNTAGNPDSEQSGMTLWGRGDYTKLSGKSDGLDWNGSLVGFQVGIDSRISDDLLVGGLVSFGNGKADYTDNRTDGAYKLKNMTSVHPYMAWTNGDMSLWGSVGYGQGRAEVSTGNVTSKVSMLSLSGGAKGKLSQTGLSLKGDISLVRTDVENTIKVDNKQRLRLVLESERQRTLASGGTITPVLEAGLRYDSGDDESGLGAVLGAGIRHNLDGWVVKGKVHAVVGQNNYQEWGIHGTIEKAPNVNQQGLSFSVNPSYGATDISMQQVYGRDQTSVSNNGTSNDYAMRLNARMDYGLSVSGIRGMLVPYSEATLGEQSRDYELGINWKRHSAFNINLSVERETRDTSKHGILLESKVQF